MPQSSHKENHWLEFVHTQIEESKILIIQSQRTVLQTKKQVQQIKEENAFIKDTLSNK